MKNKVVVKKANDEIKFYLKNDNGEFWLFTQPFSKGVYEWFKDGRSENEILRFDKWKKNKRLGDTVQRIPREIKYVTKYVSSWLNLLMLLFGIFILRKSMKETIGMIVIAIAFAIIIEIVILFSIW